MIIDGRQQQSLSMQNYVVQRKQRRLNLSAKRVGVVKVVTYFYEADTNPAVESHLRQRLVDHWQKGAGRSASPFCNHN